MTAPTRRRRRSAVFGRPSPHTGRNAAARLYPAVRESAEDAPRLQVHPAPDGVEGHWVGDGGGSWWNPFDAEESPR